MFSLTDIILGLPCLTPSTQCPRSAKLTRSSVSIANPALAPAIRQICLVHPGLRWPWNLSHHPRLGDLYHKRRIRVAAEWMEASSFLGFSLLLSR